MTALTIPPDIIQHSISDPQPRAAVTLCGVPWELYCQLRDLPDNQRKRMIYNCGTLEIMSPTLRHDRVSQILNLLIVEWTDERKIAIESVGMTTFRRKDLEQGLEADQGFYIRHAAALRAMEKVDLSVDPPPDLALEVDITSPSDSKLPVYCALGVPEVWVWKRDRLIAYVLREGQYEESSESVQLPGFPLVDAVRIMLEHWLSGQNRIRHEFCAFIQNKP